MKPWVQTPVLTIATTKTLNFPNYQTVQILTFSILVSRWLLLQWLEIFEGFFLSHVLLWDQTILELMILLPQPSECWDYRQVWITTPSSRKLKLSDNQGFFSYSQSEVNYWIKGMWEDWGGQSIHVRQQHSLYFTAGLQLTLRTLLQFP
jgi:hypothetical protein